MIRLVAQERQRKYLSLTGSGFDKIRKRPRRKLRRGAPRWRFGLLRRSRHGDWLAPQNSVRRGLRRSSLTTSLLALLVLSTDGLRSFDLEVGLPSLMAVSEFLAPPQRRRAGRLAAQPDYARERGSAQQQHTLSPGQFGCSGHHRRHGGSRKRKMGPMKNRRRWYRERGSSRTMKSGRSFVRSTGP
jgi:hypothetical protein